MSFGALRRVGDRLLFVYSDRNARTMRVRWCGHTEKVMKEEIEWYVADLWCRSNLELPGTPCPHSFDPTSLSTSFDENDLRTRRWLSDPHVRRSVAILVDRMQLLDTSHWVVRVETVNGMLNEASSSALGLEAVAACFRPHTPGGQRRLQDWFRSPSTCVAEIRRRQDAVEALLLLPYTHLSRSLTLCKSSPTRMPSTSSGDPLETMNQIRVLERYYRGVQSVCSFASQHVFKSPWTNELRAVVHAVHRWILEVRKTVALDGAELLDVDSEIASIHREGSSLTDRLNTAVRRSLVSQHGYNGSYRVVWQDTCWTVETATLKNECLNRMRKGGYELVKRSKARMQWIVPGMEHHNRAWCRHLDAVRAATLQRLECLCNKAQALDKHFATMIDNVECIDALVALTSGAETHRMVRPTTLDVDTLREPGLVLRQARHLLVEDCVPNDIVLEYSKRVMCVTGPNRAGKSTLMKIVGSAVVLHQIGSFVPADFAALPVFHTLGFRKGTEDSLQCGCSSFTRQMLDTADILRTGNPRAIAFFDELGTATSVREGEAICHAVLEHIHDLGMYCMIATHYKSVSVGRGVVGMLDNHRLTKGVTTSDAVKTAIECGFSPDVLKLVEHS